MARWGPSSFWVWGLTRGTVSWLQPSMASTPPVHCDSLLVLRGVVWHVYTREWRDLLPKRFLYCVILWGCGMGADCEFCVQDESQQTQPAADGGTQAAPDPKGLYLTAQVMTLTIFFLVEVNSNQSSGILGRSHLCTIILGINQWSTCLCILNGVTIKSVPKSFLYTIITRLHRAWQRSGKLGSFYLQMPYWCYSSATTIVYCTLSILPSHTFRK